MGLGFLDHMRVAPDHRISGMATYPLDKILLAAVVCEADDCDGVEEIATGALPPTQNSLVERHPEWKGLRSFAAVTARRTDKKSGAERRDTRFYISLLEPCPRAILASVRAHWGVENNLHWTIDVTFDEDRGRTGKAPSPLSLAVIRDTAFNILKADKTHRSLRRKRLRACIDPKFRTNLFAA